MRKFILASHGELAKSMCGTIEMICGDQSEKIKTYCLQPGEHAQDFFNELTTEIVSNRETEFVVVTDVLGGSVHNAALQLLTQENVRIFSGMNVSLVLEILFANGTYTDKMVDGILSGVRQSIQFFDHIAYEEDDDNNF